jgi:hypothetical protein
MAKSKADRESAKLAAEQRNAERAKLTPAQQLKVLDGRQGESKRERARLLAKASEPKKES